MGYLLIIFGFIGSGITLLLILIKPEVIPKWLKIIIGIIMGLLIIVGTVFQGIIHRAEQKEKEKSKYAGVLKPKKILFSSKEKQYPQFEFGDSGSILTFTETGNTRVLELFEANSLVIEVEDGVLKVSCIIRNKNGDVVAKLEGNEWRVKKEKAFDRNFTKDALEVKDEKGDIVLQIRLKENRIQFQGKLYDSEGKGNGVAIYKVIGPEGPGGLIEFIRPDKPELQMKISPMFKYPSDEHLGELICPER